MSRLDGPVRAVRRFNRFYTHRLGLLDRGLLRSDLSLTEVRVLFEMAQGAATAAELRAALDLDAAYLSRILARFERERLVHKATSPDDARSIAVALTKKGRSVFADLDRRASSQISAWLSPLSPEARQRVVKGMDAIEAALSPKDDARVSYVLRPPRAGDLGWVVARHGAIYAREYGWNEEFEGLVARIVADFVDGHDARRERCWIAEIEGEPVGSVFLVRKKKDVAQLRLLLVEPSARGLGIGGRLVDECTRFARDVGHSKIVLWTNSVLVDARRLYERAGYVKIDEEKHHSWGHDLVAQTWELRL